MREWFSASELSSASDFFPNTRQGTHAKAKSESWVKRDASEANPGVKKVEYHISNFPSSVQIELLKFHTKEQKISANQELWANFEALPDAHKEKAKQRLEAVSYYYGLVQSQQPKTVALAAISAEFSIGQATLKRYVALVRDQPRADWLPVLAPSYAGGRAKAEFTDEAWEFIRSDYLRPERPTLASCYHRAKRVGKTKTPRWKLPSLSTIERKLAAEMPMEVRVLAREGEEALKRMYPSQIRDRSHYHALEAVCADGHLFDVFVKWEDGTVSRPMAVGWQDIYSAKILSYRIDKSENADAVRLAFGDVIQNFGIPQEIFLDNGRAFASKWMSGGTPTRYRGKILDTDPTGIFKLLGCEVHWCQPRSGQSKPIERSFRDWCDYISRDPALSGAWAGNQVGNGPENRGQKAIPVETFKQLLKDGVWDHNHREGRRSHTAQGRSLEETFQESYQASVITKATQAQLQMCLLAAEKVTASKQDGSITFHGNRYYQEALAQFAGAKKSTQVVVRFDPEALQDGIYVYDKHGRFLTFAKCIEKTGFNDTETAREFNKARRSKIKHTKRLLEAERRMSAAHLDSQIPRQSEPEQQAKTKVVRPFRAEPNMDDYLTNALDALEASRAI